MALSETLRALCFNNKEIAVYTTLLQNGRMTPAELSKHTKINRATIYNIAKSLQNKGVIADDLSGRTLYFISLPVECLSEVIERPLRELKGQKHLVERAIEEASMISAEESYPVPNIRFIGEYELTDFFYANIKKWIKSVQNTDKCWWGIQDNTWLQHFSEFNDWYWSNPISRGIEMNLIGNESPEELTAYKKKLGEQRHIKFDTDTFFTSSIWVGGDYLIMIVTRQRPFYAVEIKDETLSQNMREVFKKLWNQASV